MNPRSSNSSQCQSCMDAMEAVLSNPRSQPHILLQNILGERHFTWKRHENSLLLQRPPPVPAVSNNNDDITATSVSTSEPLSIECRRCGTTGAEGNARAFVVGPDPLRVVVCQNRTQPQDLSEVLVHELVHIYDVRILRFNLLDCQKLAYSETRAAQFAECKDAFNRRLCTYRTAYSATANLFRNPTDCLNRVFDRALSDQRPFQE